MTRAHRTRRLSAASVSLLGRFGRVPIGYTLYGSSPGVAAARDSTPHKRSIAVPAAGRRTHCVVKQECGEITQGRCQAWRALRTSMYAVMLCRSYHMHATDSQHLTLKRGNDRMRLVSLAGHRQWLLGMRAGEEDGNVVVVDAVHKSLPPPSFPQALHRLACHTGTRLMRHALKL